MKTATQTSKLELTSWQKRIFGYGIGGLFVLAALYTPLAVWLASGLGHFDTIKLGKEFVLSALGAAMVYVLLTNRKLRQAVFKNKLLLWILTYVCLTGVVALSDATMHRVSPSAIIFSVVSNLRFLAFFSLVYVAVLAKTKLSWQKLVLIPAALVIGFGLLQFVLPANVLTHIGYGPQTIVPFEAVDNRPDFVRLQSVLRGANPLGAYLVIIISLASVGLLSAKSKNQKLAYGAMAVAGLVVLYGTYSRSAWLGTVLSLAIIGLIGLRKYLSKPLMLIGLVCLGGGLIIGAFLLLRNTYRFQSIVFHTSNRSTVVSSNTKRASALKSGARDVLKHPLGSGVGSAGPASVHNTKASPRLSENYYIQIGQEVGWVGLGLFVVIQWLIIKELWLRRTDPVALALLGSFLGLILVNMLSHAWTDDALAYIWWGLAAVTLAQYKRVASDTTS
ncbi:MAG: rane protein of unknown function [Candidatus Saccharibacteria bacterium]|nr:rane protein of unknown function [Candidatus Saccharibacteria bacterium]